MMRLLYIVLFSSVILGTHAQESEKTFETGKEWAEAVKKEIKQINCEDFQKRYSSAVLDGDPDFVLIDIRTKEEHNEGFIPGAFLIQRGVLEFRITSEDFWGELSREVPDRDQKIILYCRSGNRSALGAKSLMMMGYTNVESLEGGWKGWNEKYPNLKKVN